MPRPANPAVREALLYSGGRLIHERGYNATGVKDIVDAAGVPKGSFYSYFDSKEALLVEVVERYWDDVARRHGGLLDDASTAPRQRVVAFFTALADDHELRNYSLGCLLGSMTLEMSNISAPARDALTAIFAGWEERLAATLTEAQERGELAASRDVRELAAALIEAWEGAAMRGKATQDRAPYDRFERVTLPLFLGGN